MRGSIRQRKSGSWELRVSLGSDPITGERRSVSRTAIGGKRDAEWALAQLVTELSAISASPRAMTVSELVEKHLERFEGSPTTLRGYQHVLERHIRPTIGRYRIGEVGPAVLDELYDRLTNESNLAPSTIRQVHAVLRGAFARAVKWKWLGSNPARDASPPTVRRKEIVLPTAEQIGAAIVQADRLNPDFGVFVRLAAATGARRGELCALRWNAVDLDGGAVVIKHSAITVTGGGVVIKDTKNHSRRRVSIDADTVIALRGHRRAMDQRARHARMTLADDAFVFSHEPDSGKPWYVDNISTNWDKVRTAIGLHGVRLHDLRHFQATMLLQAGIAVPTVSKRIGHRDSATTLNVYAHFIEQADEDSARVMGNLLAVKAANPAPGGDETAPAPKRRGRPPKPR
jgi:integrase